MFKNRAFNPLCANHLRYALIALAAITLTACHKTERDTETAVNGFAMEGLPGSSLYGEVIAMGGGSGGVTRACFSCHGLDGEGMEKPSQSAPALAGLDQGYLHRQLDDYANGRRRHTAMSDIVSILEPRERAAVSQYYSNLPLPIYAPAGADAMANALYQNGDAARDIAACAQCHGRNGEGMGAANPRLAGQPAPYLADQLLAWKRGDRQNDPSHAMQVISQALTLSEIEQLSVYAASL